MFGQIHVITPPPRGPRSGPGYSVPVRHHLIGPIRPTRRHIALSPHGGLYAMPSLCGSVEATRECCESSSLLRWDVGGILGVMPTRRSAETTPDRVSTPPPEGARPP